MDFDLGAFNSVKWDILTQGVARFMLLNIQEFNL